MKRYLLLAVCVAAVLLGACSTESKLPKATGEGTVRAINTIAASPNIFFLIEERQIGTASYQGSSSSSTYDDLSYTFNFEVLLAGDTARTRVASQPLDVEADMDYTFLITGTIAAPVISVWQAAEREWAGTETTFEMRFGHTAVSLADVDAYFAAPGIVPMLGSELDTLSFGGITAASEYEAGEYVLTITAAGDPTTVLFESDPVTPIAQTAIILSVFDGDENDLSPLAVSLINMSSGGTGSLVDSSYPPTVRYFHASMGFGSINMSATDIYIDDPATSMPFVADHVFGDVTGDLVVTPGVLSQSYTEAGNVGAPLLDLDSTILSGTRYEHYLVKNTAGDALLISHIPDRRSVETFARVSFLHTAAAQANLDIYVVARDELIDELTPTFPGLPLSILPITIPFNADSYDIYATVTGEKTVLAGPIQLDLAVGDVVNTIIYENVDPNVVDFVFIPLP